MKSFFTFLALSLCGITFSQISYTSANAPKPGHKSEYKYLENIQGIDLNALTQAGSDKTWNIAGQDVDGNREGFISIDAYPFKNYFPTANLASVDLDEPDTTFSIFEVNSNGVYWLGSYDTSTTIVWKDKYIFVPFPLNFGQNFQNGTEADVTQGTTSGKIEIQSNANADGWGMLTTNEGTYPVLKVKTKQITEITVSGIPFGSSTFEYHHWYASGIVGPVAEFTISETESIFTGIENDTTIRFLHKQELVADKDIETVIPKLILTPNPATDFFQMEINGIDFDQAVYTLINAEGKTVGSGNFNKNQNQPIAIQNLPAGNYFVQLILDKKTLLFEILHKK